MSYFPARVSFCLFVSGFRAHLVDLYLYLQSKRFMTGLVFAFFFFFKKVSHEVPEAHKKLYKLTPPELKQYLNKHMKAAG